MSKIKNAKEAKDLFGFNASHGGVNITDIAQEIKGQSVEELISTLSNTKTKEALRERLEKTRIEGIKRGRGRPRTMESDNEIRMTFIVKKEQLEKIREIGYREVKFTKEILSEALGAYIEEYERKEGVVIPGGKSKL